MHAWRCFRLLAAGAALLCFLTGCWDRREINDVAIVMATAVDLEENGQFRVSLQIPLPGQMGGATGGGGGTGGEETFYVDSSTGSTIWDAVGKLTSRTSRELNFSHRRIFIISEAVAKREISSIFNSVVSLPENRLSSVIVISKGKAADLLTVQTKLERFSSEFIRELLQIGKPVALNIKDLALRLQDPTTEPYIPYIGIQSAEVTHKQIELLGYAQFQQDRMVGIFEEREMLGLQWLAGFQPYLEYVSLEENKVTLFVKQGKTSITAKIRDGRPHFHVHALAVAQIFEEQNNLDLTKTEVHRKFQDLLERSIKFNIEAAIRQMQSKNTDSVSFGKYLFRRYPKEWNHRFRDHWHDHFAQATFTVEASGVIENIGMTTRNIVR